LRSEAELARDALAAPLLAGAARLARWTGPGTRVGEGGELRAEQLPAAAAELGLGAGADGARYAEEAWAIALDLGFVRVANPDEQAGGAAADAQGDGPEATAGAELDLLTSGSPADVLDLWLDALETTIAEACLPAPGGPGGIAASEDGAGAGWADVDLAAEADFLDGVLGNLYLLSVGEDGTGDGRVPLPALAASMIVPEGMAEPTDDVLHEVSLAMVRLDEQFRMLAQVGLVEFQPVDEELMADVEGAEDADAAGPGGTPGSEGSETDVTRYGMVRLTALGRFGLHARLAEAGFEAPVVGDLADQGAEALLQGTADFPQSAAQDEIEQWLARRAPLDGARELLTAARGADDRAPLRRLRCQQALSLVGRVAEPALREVLGDRELGGLARVWLTEQGVPDVPAPTEDMVFWLTIDTLAAQLAAEGNSQELQGLLQGLAEQHSGFFDTAWRVDHPATARVLQTMGRLHPDKRIAKEARKAAFKALSRTQHGS
jgi:hypothetical protein